MQINDSKNKSDINEIYILNLQEQVDDIQEKVNEIEQRLNKLTMNSKDKISEIKNNVGKRGVEMEQLAKQVNQANKKLDQMAKDINNFRFQNLESERDKIEMIADKNNRGKLLLILILGAALLMSLGASLGEISEFLNIFNLLG